MADVKIYTATKTDEVIAQAINSKGLNSVVKDVAITEDGTGIKVVRSNGTETVVNFPAGGSVGSGLTQADIDSAIDALNLEQYALKSDIPDPQDLAGGVDEAEVRAIVESMDLGGAGIPIFATLAEAEAFEVANPGKLALTIESTEPDTTPPTLGTMTITSDGTKATAVVSGAKDDRGAVEFSFQLDDGVWTDWQVSPSYEFTGLTVATTYSAKHKVRGRAGHEVVGYAVSFTTLEADQWGTIAFDSFNGSGSLIGREFETGGLKWIAPDHDGVHDTPSTTGNVHPSVLDGVVYGEGNGSMGNHGNAGPYLEGASYWQSESTGKINLGGRMPSFGGLVKLPVTYPKRVRMEMTAFCGYKNPGGAAHRIYPVIAGVSTREYSAVQWNRATDSTISPRFIEKPTNTDDLWEVTFPELKMWKYDSIVKYIVEVEGPKVTFSSSAGESVVIEDAAKGMYGGPVYGFIFNSMNPSSAVHDFRIQWE